MQAVPTEGFLYQHTIKGGEYMCMGISINTETGAREVIYRETTGERRLFNRPLRTEDKQRPDHKAWLENNLDGSPRFKRVL